MPIAASDEAALGSECHDQLIMSVMDAEKECR